MGKTKEASGRLPFLMEIVGVEPMTYRLRTCRSTN